MKTGFQLRALRVTSKKRKVAALEFRPGLNVVAGASNTGKSYILGCIDFMLGATKPPKAITESVGYESVELEFEDHSGVLHRFERSLKGGDVSHRIRSGDAWKSADPEILAWRHAPSDPETISGVLLNLCGFWGRKIRTNEAGKLVTLSFRDLAHLSVINEKRIIDDGSPILSGQYTEKTKEIGVFRLLLTGIDDSSVIARESRKENLARKRAQLELLDRMIARLEQQIATAEKEPTSVAERRKRRDEAIARHTQVILASQEEIAAEQLRRQLAWTSAQQTTAKRDATLELRNRFKLLEDHYQSDLARLNAIIEADHYFAQLRTVVCPLCGAPVDQHDEHQHSEHSDGLRDLRIACKAEIEKIQILLRDLVGTTAQLDQELSSLAHQREQHESTFATATQTIQEQLAPKAQQLQGELETLISDRDQLAYIEMLQERLLSMQDERDAIASIVWQPRPTDDVPKMLVSQPLETFTLAAQELLTAWKYPELTRVTFNQELIDLIVSGKDRASEGKGFRAIGYSAFIIGLLRYCYENNLPHPGIVVLDSPLVTYKRRDTQPGEEIPEDVSKAFYEDLANTPADLQIIVLENEDPPKEVQAKIQYEHFSRSKEIGRYGFFPINSDGPSPSDPQ